MYLNSHDFLYTNNRNAKPKRTDANKSKIAKASKTMHIFPNLIVCQETRICVKLAALLKYMYYPDGNRWSAIKTNCLYDQSIFVLTKWINFGVPIDNAYNNNHRSNKWILKNHRCCFPSKFFFSISCANRQICMVYSWEKIENVLSNDIRWNEIIRCE